MSESPVSLVNQFTVLDRRNSTAGYSLVRLKSPGSFIYAAGQCINIGFTGIEESETRAFSIASSPTEDIIILLVKHGTSNYKHKLLAVKPGDKLLGSAPTGGFEFSNQLPALMIAGGIGIAPFRSIIKYEIDRTNDQKLQLIHLYPRSQSPFAEEFNEWQRQHDFFSFSSLTEGTKRSSLRALLQRQPQFGSKNLLYYLAGPPDMVTECSLALEENGVSATAIRVDRLTAPISAGH